MNEVDKKTDQEVQRDLELSIHQLNQRLQDDPDRSNRRILEGLVGDDLWEWESFLDGLQDRGLKPVFTIDVRWTK